MNTFLRVNNFGDLRSPSPAMQNLEDRRVSKIFSVPFIQTLNCRHLERVRLYVCLFYSIFFGSIFTGSNPTETGADFVSAHVTHFQNQGLHFADESSFSMISVYGEI